MAKGITPVKLDSLALQRTHDGYYSKAYLAKHVGGMKNLNRLLREYPEKIPPYFGDNDQRAVYSICDVMEAIRIDRERILEEKGILYIYKS